MNNILIIIATIAFYISLKKEKTNLEKKKKFLIFIYKISLFLKVDLLYQKLGISVY